MFFRLTPGPKIYDAIQQAIANAGSSYNALAEVRIYEQMHTNILSTYYCFVVEGLPVRYGQGAIPKHYTPVKKSNPQETRGSQWDF